MKAWTRRTALSTVCTPALLTAACAAPRPAGDSGVPKLSTTPITITTQITDMNPAMVNGWPTEMAGPYKQRRPTVTIELLLMPSTATLVTFEQLTANMAAGTPPDVFEGPRFADWTVAKGFTDTTLDSLVKRDKFDTKVFSQGEFIGAHTVQGKVAQIPYKHGGNMLSMLINMNHFEEAGVQLPPTEVSRAWNADQYLQALTRLTRSGGGEITQFGGTLPGSPVYTWPLLWGSDWLSDDLKTVTCDSAAMVAGYQWMQDAAYRHHVVPRAGEAARLFPNTNLFMTGKVAIAWTGAASYVNLMNQARDNNIKITVAPAPALKVSTPDVNSHGLFIVKGSKHTEDSWEVIKYFSERSRLATYARAMTTILSDLEVTVREASRPHQAIDARIIKQILETAKKGVNLKRHSNQDEMLRILNPAMAELNENKIPAADLLRRIKPQLQQVADQK